MWESLSKMIRNFCEGEEFGLERTIWSLAFAWQSQNDDGDDDDDDDGKDDCYFLQTAEQQHFFLATRGSGSVVEMWFSKREIRKWLFDVPFFRQFWRWRRRRRRQRRTVDWGLSYFLSLLPVMTFASKSRKRFKSNEWTSKLCPTFQQCSTFQRHCWILDLGLPDQ